LSSFLCGRRGQSPSVPIRPVIYCLPELRKIALVFAAIRRQLPFSALLKLYDIIDPSGASSHTLWAVMRSFCITAAQAFLSEVDICAEQQTTEHG